MALDQTLQTAPQRGRGENGDGGQQYQTEAGVGEHDAVLDLVRVDAGEIE